MSIRLFVVFLDAMNLQLILTDESLERKKQYRNSNATSERHLPNYVVTRKGNSTRIIKYPAIYQHELNFRARLSVFVPSKGSNISLMLWHLLSDTGWMENQVKIGNIFWGIFSNCFFPNCQKISKKILQKKCLS